jgi:hypothetical protein
VEGHCTVRTAYTLPFRYNEQPLCRTHSAICQCGNVQRNVPQFTLTLRKAVSHRTLFLCTEGYSLKGTVTQLHCPMPGGGAQLVASCYIHPYVTRICGLADEHSSNWCDRGFNGTFQRFCQTTDSGDCSGQSVSSHVV